MSVRSLFPDARGVSLRLLLVFSLLACAAPARGQQSNPPQKAGDDEDVVNVRSHLVNVDVSVKDKKGNYITDLKAGDFTVFENGVRQKVAFFNPPLAGGGESTAAGEATKAGGARTSQPGMPRNIVSLVLDGLNTDPANMKRVRDGAVKYIKEQVTETDAVALFSVTGGLQLFQPFTHDKEKLLAAVDRAADASASSKTSEQHDI